MKYRVTVTQHGYGTLRGVVEVEAENEEEAEELAMESDIRWEVSKFSGDGYDVESVEEED